VRVAIAVLAVSALVGCQGVARSPEGGAGGASPAPTSPSPERQEPESQEPSAPFQKPLATVTCDDRGPDGGGASIGVQTEIEHPVVLEDPFGIRVGVRNLTSFDVFIEVRGPGIRRAIEPIAPGDGEALLSLGVGDHLVRCNRILSDRVGSGPPADVGWVELQVVDPLAPTCRGGETAVVVADGGLMATTPRPPCRV
jgi:hypothetical protein